MALLEAQVASRYEPVLQIFHSGTACQKARAQMMFIKLKCAYIEVRYQNPFKVSLRMLKYLGLKIAQLQQLVFDACTKQVQHYYPQEKVLPYQPSHELLNIRKLVKSKPPQQIIEHQQIQLQQEKTEKEIERQARIQAEKKAEEERKEKERLLEKLKAAGLEP